MNDIRPQRLTLPRTKALPSEARLTLPRIVRHMAPAPRCPQLAPTVYLPSPALTAAARRCA